MAQSLSNVLCLLFLGIVIPSSFQQQRLHNRCDAQIALKYSTPCTACAAAPDVRCPVGFRRQSSAFGDANCSYTVQIGQRVVNLKGCSHTCVKVETEHRCCPGFWGPRCLPCPSWSNKVCNWHGVCSDGHMGNGTCQCESGFTGLACQECSDKNAYGPHCSSVCNCVNGDCNSGPDGDGKCLCQPPYSGPKCDIVSESCRNCAAHFYCDGEGSAAVCKCLPRYAKIGQVCAAVCLPGSCGKDADCVVRDQRVECDCKTGFKGDGKVCVPEDPCAVSNGGCPINSTICEYKGPGQVICSCLKGMVGDNPSKGCTLVANCNCHPNAQCLVQRDGINRCLCKPQEVGDGYRCYGNIIERLLELNAGDLTPAITFFGSMCELPLGERGPFTALVPTQQFIPQQSMSCKHHLILGQHLDYELDGKDMQTYSGQTIRFKNDKQFIFMKDPDTVFTITKNNIVASNGVIHLIDKAISNIPAIVSTNTQHTTQTIGQIIAEDTRFNRFVSLVDNCGTRMPLRGQGPLTVFVPTNKAIDRFRDGSVLYMLSEAKHKLQQLLRHHMFSKAALTVDQLSTMYEIQTMANEVVRIRLSGDGRILLGEKEVPLEIVEILASNGVIHLIDGVLVPPSIVPILPHRCDVNESKIIQGPCVQCHILYTTECPSGSVEMDNFLTGCNPLPFYSNIKGCAKYCKATTQRPDCCKGFYGPDCKPCLGGFTNPCYGKGNCLDGIQGNGTCQCNIGFEGIACHICANPNKHGENCDEDCRCVHGECDNRPGGGICRSGSCQEGYFGELCDKVPTPCNSDGVFEHCHINAFCTFIGGNTVCMCQKGYEGDGHTCIPINPCLKPDGGDCDINAHCVYHSPGNASCICNDGWAGGGTRCYEIENCLMEDRGGCDKNAECKASGPGLNTCSCKKGYVGDGKSCTLLNPCLKNNGGCSMLATCNKTGDGLRECICPENYHGDGTTCYGSILMELDGSFNYYNFYNLIQKYHLSDLDGNITALVPSRQAFKNLTKAEETFWFDYYRLPHLLRAHFLDGVFSYTDLQQRVNQQLPTLQKSTKWEVKNETGEIKIGNAKLLSTNILAVNGFIHIIDTVLKPPLSVLPPLPPDLMDLLNKTPEFSLFTQAAIRFNLSASVSKDGHTVLIPFDSAIKEHLKNTNSSELDENDFKYHVIPNEQLFPDHITDGALRETLLGKDYNIMFHVDSRNQTMANGVPLNGTFYETRRGVVIGIPKVLEIHKNRCSNDVFLQVSGRCGPCDSTPKCYSGAKPMKESFLNMKSNCKYRKKVGARRRSMPGCTMSCLKKVSNHQCCPGYYGHECYKCPGKINNPCYGHGKCNDTLSGTGECRCFEGFHGIACEMCEPGRYGQNCSYECKCVNGKCLDGIDGNGKCVCNKGWKGPQCAEVGEDLCQGKCHQNANCQSVGLCSCIAGYRGDGFTCKEINLCELGLSGCSPHAKCTHIGPGEKKCDCKEGYWGDGVVCEEINPCTKRNGGCNMDALCINTGPNLHTCVCRPGYIGDGIVCSPLNICRKDNGGCSINAKCRSTGPGERNCTCYPGYRGDGLVCSGSVSRELLRQPAAEWYRRELMIAKVRDTVSKGPLTVFVPHNDYIENSTLKEFQLWSDANRAPDLLRYHIVSCEELSLDDLKTTGTVLALSGHELKFSYKENVLYLNDDAKVVQSDHLASNGVIHFIDKILSPYDLKKKPVISPKMNVTAAAEAYGYKQFSKLLRDANLVPVLENKMLQPFTMFWPTDQVFNSLSADRKTWLYSEDHRDKLEAFLKAHIIQDNRISAAQLPREKLRSLYGSLYLSFSCDKSKTGKLLINDNAAQIVERHLVFESGIAYGIDQLLEPPDLGARCDGLAGKIVTGLCGSCLIPPDCMSHSVDTGKTQKCLRYSSAYRRHPWGRFPSFYDNSFLSRVGCKRECNMTRWTFRCCKNHYGSNCQVCPGGLEAPCGNHGDCNDGLSGTGQCKCYTGFQGSACEVCINNHYGPNCTACNCTANGNCDDGLEGSGECVCAEGWTGKSCESKLVIKPVCKTPCHQKAICLADDQCECQDPYIGDGISCTAPDFCSEYNGGCNQHANCLQVDVNVTCTCQPGYSGDGIDCSPIDRCAENNGGCDDFATCTFTGPNERECHCSTGYVGDGIQCLEVVIPPIDRCLENNGGCDPKASCKDLHFHTKTAGVYHLRSKEGKYKMNFTMAEAACKAEGAALATFSQLSDAQQLGLQLCVAGWFDGKKVGYPMRAPSAKCGDGRVGIILYKDPVNTGSMYDAYCYRMQDVNCICRPGYDGDGQICFGNLVNVLATQGKLSIFYTTLMRYATTSAEGENLLKFLTEPSSFITLFVPQDQGLFTNETLTWRDIQYHISVNNSVHFYENLTHNMFIPSRLGRNLTIAVTAAEATASDSASAHKLVDKRRIVDWNIPAINGIIHIIEGALKAPPPIVAPAPFHQTAGGSGAFVVVTLLVILAAAAGYYVFRNKTDAFHFQFFKNEDERGLTSENTNPDLVSIPNPCYSGYTAFSEPFGDIGNKETTEQPNPDE